ncbi:cation:proton antiporter [Streptomyces celluloflavus]|uniref:cation:proton antiporter n=1 Tax=Streptomyces celluloflavus TaxID=58344 RepID=UPI00346033DC|nr:cation:proton antiporter [Streptomyces celluloflavus]
MAGSSLEAIVLVDIAVVLLIGVALAPLRTRLRQPVVVGEIAVGVLLGPSVLGLLPGNLPAKVFPVEVRSHLSVIAQVGIVLFMFVAGWELEFHLLRGRVRSVLAITAASLTVPCALASAVAFALFAGHSSLVPAHISPLLFMLFMGVVLSVSSLSVMIRILGENGLQGTTAGAMATASGAITDLVAWFAFVCLITAAQGLSTGNLLLTLGRVTAYSLAMGFVVRPVLRALLRRVHPQGGHSLLLIFAVGSGVFVSAWFATCIGIHAVIGAFTFGLVMPRDLDPAVRRAIATPLHHVGALLIPVFFGLTGLSVDMGALGWGGALALTAFFVVSLSGKFTGTAVTARLFHLPWREAATVGVLVNSKGLGEVLMLTMGREAGLINDQLFSALFLTALLMTASVNPLVRRLTPKTGGTDPGAAVPAQQQGPHAAPELSDDHTTRGPT